MDLLTGLATVLPEGRVVSGEEELKRHEGGIFTYHAPVRPDAVVYPEGRDEVVETLRFANEHRIPIVPFGEGSSLEAHT
ncbi:MAG TPA: FAD-binding protein, partial [Rubrobacter sp.]|nr:FAD-binding protein [Rubrobacter sp.]